MRLRPPWPRRDPPATPEAAGLSGPVRLDKRTKNLVKRLKPGDVAVIDHLDIDRVAAETLVEKAPVVVVNAAQSITGRYPNAGPAVLVEAGIPLLDAVGDRKSTRLNSSHTVISYAVFCLKKKKKKETKTISKKEKEHQNKQ